MSNIKIFDNTQFGAIRVYEVNGKPMFCLKDICKALSLRTDGVLPRLDKDGYNQIGVIDSLGRTQQAYFISEKNLYRVILRSDKEEAIKFQDWICDEVLPSIRKTGAYQLNSMTDTKDMELRGKELRFKEAELYWKMSESGKFLPKYSEILEIHAANTLLGSNTIPLPASVKQVRRLTATEVGKRVSDELGWNKPVSSNMIGRITKEYNMQTAEYGELIENIAPNGRQIPSFEYYEDKMKEIKLAVYAYKQSHPKCALRNL